MKKWIFYVIVTLLIALGINSQAQSLPDSLLNNIIDELVVCDGMRYKLNAQDSIITIYKKMDENNKLIIEQYKLNEKQYNKIVDDLKEVNQIDQDTIKELKREIKIHKIKEIIIVVLGVALIVVMQ